MLALTVQPLPGDTSGSVVVVALPGDTSGIVVVVVALRGDTSEIPCQELVELANQELDKEKKSTSQ